MRSTLSRAGSRPSSTHPHAGSSRPRASIAIASVRSGHKGRELPPRPQPQHLFRQGHCRAAHDAERGFRILPVQVEVLRGERARVPAPDRRLSSPRHWLLFLQRRRGFPGHCPQGVPAGRAARISDHLHRDSQDGRQRSSVHGLLSRLRIRCQVRRGIHPRSGHGRRVDVRDLHQGVHPRGHGASRGLEPWPRKGRAMRLTSSCCRRCPSIGNVFSPRFGRPWTGAVTA